MWPLITFALSSPLPQIIYAILTSERLPAQLPYLTELDRIGLGQPVGVGSGYLGWRYMECLQVFGRLPSLDLALLEWVLRVLQYSCPAHSSHDCPLFYSLQLGEPNLRVAEYLLACGAARRSCIVRALAVVVF